MPTSNSSRTRVAASLVTLFVLNAILGLGGQSDSAIMRYGRPVAIGLLCLLVWQGRSWARVLVVILSLGALLAGPLAWANGLPPWRPLGAAFWLMTALAGLSMGVLFANPLPRTTSAEGPPVRQASP